MDKPAPDRHVNPPEVGDAVLAMVAGEHSGDHLGGPLMAALRANAGRELSFMGVGGENMQAEGLHSLFPMSEVAVMGPAAIARQLPRIVRRVYETVDAIVAARPDLLVIIDSPEFTHSIAKRVRRHCPEVPVIDYVSPSVWAWRPGRARKMKAYVDHVLGLLPFEPAAHQRLGGPACTYVGHPLIERLDWIDSLDLESFRRRHELDPARPVLTVLPGSRMSEVSRLAPIFGAALEHLASRLGTPPQVVVPCVPWLHDAVAEMVQAWPGAPRLLDGEADKFAAFRASRAALAASGTVTLELALCRTPMVVAYRVGGVEGMLRPLITADSVVLANLVLGEQAFPEFLQRDCTPDRLSGALGEILVDGPARHDQLGALERVAGRMHLPSGIRPSRAAADVILRYLNAA